MAIARIDNGQIVEERDLEISDVPVHKQSLWLPIVGSEPAYDHDIHAITGPTKTVEADRVQLSWVVSDKDIGLVRKTFSKRVDNDAEKIRLKHITPGDGMMMTYREKLEQAEQAIGQGQAAIDALTTEEEQAAYPTLAASVGIEANTLWECAQLVMATYQAWATLSHNIEKIRLAGKKAIDDAASVDDARAAYQAVDWGTL